jgi:hypothetical protein
MNADLAIWLPSNVNQVTNAMIASSTISLAKLVGDLFRNMSSIICSLFSFTVDREVEAMFYPTRSFTNCLPQASASRLSSSVGLEVELC